MKKLGVVIVLLFVFLIGLASADFTIGNQSHSVEKEYAPSGYLTGWINISFDKESSGSLFTDTSGNSISLINLLKNTSNFNYNCSSINCTSIYEVYEPETEKSFLLSKGEKKKVGLKVIGNIDSINSISFKVSSDNNALSCENQVKIDFFEDNVFELGNNKSTLESCSELRNYSCFKANETIEEYIVRKTPYCQRIRLLEAPGFKVGAWIKNVSSFSDNLIMQLYDGNKELVDGFCELPPIETQGEVFCDIDYLVTEPKDYYLCIYARVGGGYRIRGNEIPENPCGFNQAPIGTHTSAYQIFAQPRKFNSLGTLQVANTLPNGESIPDMIQDYIMEEYQNLDCSDECIIPIEFLSGIDQTISLKDLNFVYRKTSGEIVSEDFYDIIPTYSKISADFQKLFLDKGDFKLSSSIKNISYKLKLRGEELFTEKLTIGKVPVITNIFPRTTALGFPTKFIASVDELGGNVTRYDWNFDGTSTRTLKNEIIYTFGSLGIHNLTLTVTDTNSKSTSKKYQITVSTPEAQINQSIDNTEKKITDLKIIIGEFPSFYQASLKKVLDLEEIEIKLADIKSKYSAADSEEDYLEIVGILISIELPDSLSTSKSANEILFFPEKYNINLDIIKKIASGSYDPNDEENYKDAILIWNQQNIETRINFKEISSVIEGIEEPVLKVFELETSEKEEISYSSFLIIENLSDLNFKQNYNAEEESGYYYIELSPGENSFSFVTTEDVDFVDLPAFISPALSELKIDSIKICSSDEDCTGDDVCDKGICVEEGTSKWTLFTLIIIFLIIIGFVVYIILQQWYKNKYETHLFKNRNNLLNLLTYINNQRKIGIFDDEIVKKLKKSKWKSEQINYAMKKYVGKRTGMFELPFFKIFDKKQQEFLQRNNIGLRQGYIPGKRPFNPRGEM
ncbi:MAG: PKD domain-containing protein [archaeon]